MKVKNYCQKAAAPTAFVTKGRQRVKQHGNVIYLKDRDEFEIELFNPINSKILAKIRLNGSYISETGLVLRPGERVFLERYLNEARKFMFETYNVDGSDSDILQAIKNNGEVEVEFYEEHTPIIWNVQTVTSYPSYNWTWHPYITYTSGNTDCNFFHTADSITFVNDSYKLQNDDSKETGRVEKGEHSNQNFQNDYGSYNSYFTWNVEWKILPVSAKPYLKEDLKVFCTECGTKRKKSTHKFCPNCGKKFD